MNLPAQEKEPVSINVHSMDAAKKARRGHVESASEAEERPELWRALPALQA